MAFECKNCGQCCIDECTQINLSVGDIVRILKFKGCSMSEIMPKIGIKPFADTENTSKYDYELGLNIPCEFRREGRCSIYPARPLNCRIFPYVFLGNVPLNELKNFIDPSHKCISGAMNISDEEKKRYHDYARFIGSLILKEAEQTEVFYIKNSLKQSSILPAYIFPSEDPDNPMHAKEITKSKIKMAMSIMNQSSYSSLKNQLQNFIMAVEDGIASVDEINKKEKELIP